MKRLRGANTFADYHPAAEQRQHETLEADRALDEFLRMADAWCSSKGPFLRGSPRSP